MRYEDTSGSFSSAAAAAPDARDDTDTLAAGSRSPATGNAISGAGTITGSTGADIVGNAPGHIVALQGANGSDTADGGGSLQAAGRYGALTMNQDGSYSYRPSGPAPENARDVFSYTLADQSGGRDTAMLTIDIGHTPSVEANAQQIVPGPDGVVTLPPGVELSDVHVVGRNLVIDLPDGSQMVIIDGAVFVPQLVLNGVEVPSSNLAALLVDSEPKPAAGTPLSSGGNFAVDLGPLDPGVPLGDLIPPTELDYIPPDFEDVNEFEDDEPEIIIIPDGQPGAVNAADSVDESGLPERLDEPEGTLEPQDIETTTGVISISAEDGIDNVTINGVEIDSIGDTVETARGVLTITSIDLDSGQIGYSYTVTDNTIEGVDDFDDFTIVVTDEDGDTATGTLHIDIADDEPIARNDTDSVTLENPIAVGNVMTAEGTTNSPAGIDTVGADDASLTAVQGVGPADTTFDINGNLVVEGQFGTLTIDAEGEYTYVRDVENFEGGTDVFTYTLTDGDGDIRTATLTITVPVIPVEENEPPVVADAVVVVTEEALEGGLPDDDGEFEPSNSATASGDVIVNDPDGDPTTATLGVPTTTLFSGGVEVEWSVSPDGHTLTGTAGATTIITVTINDSGEFQVQLLGPVDHSDPNSEDGLEFDVPVTVSDGTDTVPATITVRVADDSPDADVDSQFDAAIVLDESPTDEDEGPGDFDPAGRSTIVVDLSAAFVTPPQYGGDGPGSVNDGISYALVLTGTDVPSGMFGLEVGDTDDGGDGDGIGQGEAIVLNQDPVTGVITGSGAVSGDSYFTISVDAETGEVTFTQIENVWHSNTGSDDDTSSINIDAEDGSLNLVQTIEDADGDTDSASVNLGNDAFQIEDDGPSIGEVDINDSIVIDETDAGTPGGFPLTQTTTNPVITGSDISTGTDGGTTSYGLILAGAVATLPSGLQTAQGDHAITLVQIDADTIEGQYEDGGTQVAFTIEIGTDGKLTYTQEVPLEHSDDGSDATAHNDTNSPIDFGGLISATITVTDTDGDSVSASADLGDAITIFDDGPVAELDPEFQAPGLLVDESPLPTDGDGIASDTQDFSGAFVLPPDFGADGEGDVEYSLSLNGTELGSGLYALDPTDTVDDADGIGQGDEIMLVDNGDGTISGVVGTDVYFTISVDADTGEVTFEQFMNVWHGDTGDNDDGSFLTAAAETIMLDQTVTDSDGDTSVASFDLSDDIFQIQDDGPEATLDTNTVTEGDTLTVVEADGVLSNDDFGTDGPGTIVGVEAGDDTSSPVTGGVGSEIDGTYGKLTLQADGSYTYVSTDGAVPPLGATDTFVYTIVDADGDSSTVTLTITLDNANQIPVAGETSAAVDDDGLTGGLAGGDGDIDADDGEVGAGVGDESVYTGTLDGTGGDDPVTFLFDAALDGTTDTVGTEEVEYTVSLDGSTLTATISSTDARDGLELFNVVITDASTGAYTLTLVNNVLHEEGGNDETSAFLDIPYQMSDLDGDNSVLDGTLHVEFNDDTPEAFETDAVNVEQEGSASASLDIDDGDITNNYGADGGTVRFPPDIEGSDSGLKSGGATIFYHIVDDTHLQGVLADDTVIFTIELNESDVADPNDVVGSSYTIDLDGVIDSNKEINFNDGSYDFVGGNDPWAAFVDPDLANSQDLLLTPFSDTGEGNAINGNANSAGVTGGGGGQNIGTGEGIRLDYVIDITGNPAGAPANYDGNVAQQDHVFGDHYGVNDATARFGDGQDDTTISVKAFDADDSTNLVYHNGSLVSITEIIIRFDGENQVVTFDPLDLSQTVTVGIVDGIPDRTYTVEWVEDGGEYYVEITGILDIATRISVHGETNYEALEIQHLDGDDFAITGFGAVTQSTDPVPFSVPVEIVDGDGDVVGGTDLDITVYAVGDLPAPLAATSSFSAEVETMPLLIDDGSTSNKAYNRSFDAANNNTVLLGAIAAAGLGSTAAGANYRGFDSDGELNSQLTSATDNGSDVSETSGSDVSRSALGGESKEAVEHNGASGGSRSDSADSGDHSLTDGDAPETQGPTELLAGTETPDAPAASTFTSGAVVMPTADMVLEATGDGTAEGEAKTNGEVGRVLADALAGGGDGPSIEAIIDAVANHGPGGAKGSVEGLASQGHGAVSGWDTAGFAGFQSHAQFTMENIQLHHDAVQPAA